MRDRDLLIELLEAETEDAAVAALESRGLLANRARWHYLGGMPNNQSIVHAQQSSAAAALIEKYTNGVDAILLRACKARGIDPRGSAAPTSMAGAIEALLGDAAERFARASTGAASRDELRQFAEEHLVLYATGTKARPSLSIYDAGEGQFAEDFPSTFCSLIHGSSGGSYKGAIPFVQGRFNMGSSGVLPFCSERYKMQLVVSRVPPDVARSTDHEWAYTIVCFFNSKQDPSWHYLVGSDGKILTAGPELLALVPRLGAKSGEASQPRERKVDSGTLIKMYDFKAPRSNICGELFKKIEEFLLRPPLPLRIVECRSDYRANVMRVTVWDRLAVWAAKDKLEPGFESGASVSIQLETGEVVPAEIRVFKAVKKDGANADGDEDQPQTGLRAIINGQSHARRDAQFFRNQSVDKEHIAGSMLVLLDCTDLCQGSRNALFMSNRETFREDPLLQDLFKKLQRELKNHEGLIELNKRRYEEKVRDAVSDDDGIKALEELLETDPDLAALIGSAISGAVAARTATAEVTGDIDTKADAFVGKEFPTFFHRPDKSTSAEIVVPKGGATGVTFLTDVRNDYFTRRKHRGQQAFAGDIVPTARLFNGRLSLTFAADRTAEEGTALRCETTITDNCGSGPFRLEISLKVGPAVERKAPTTPRTPPPPRADVAPSRPDIQEVHEGADAPPLTIQQVPGSERLKLLINLDSRHLENARLMRPPEETVAVEFVFKYGLALTALSLLDAARKTTDWGSDPAGCRERVQDTVTGLARVIVPLCLSLPKKLPKAK